MKVLADDWMIIVVSVSIPRTGFINLKGEDLSVHISQFAFVSIPRTGFINLKEAG